MLEAPKQQNTTPLEGGSSVKPFVPQRGDRVVFQGNYDEEPLVAIIAHVWPQSDGKLLNLCVIGRDGDAVGHTRVSRGASVGTWRPRGATE